MSFVLFFCAGLFAGGLVLIPAMRRQRGMVQALLAQQADAEARMEAQNQVGAVDLQLQIDHAHAIQRSLELKAGCTRMRDEYEQLQQSYAHLRCSQTGAYAQAGKLASSLDELQAIELTFDRWHADMTRLLDHNRQMHSKNDDFSQIVRQMVMVGLNASIEAAHAGAMGRGFGVVATEMRELSARAESLSADYRNALYENDLITTTTFQDMQASGRMIIGAVRGLALTNRTSIELLTAQSEFA